MRLEQHFAGVASSVEALKATQNTGFKQRYSPCTGVRLCSPASWLLLQRSQCPLCSSSQTEDCFESGKYQLEQGYCRQHTLPPGAAP